MFGVQELTEYQQNTAKNYKNNFKGNFSQIALYQTGVFILTSSSIVNPLCGWNGAQVRMHRRLPLKAIHESEAGTKPPRALDALTAICLCRCIIYLQFIWPIMFAKRNRFLVKRIWPLTCAHHLSSLNCGPQFVQLSFAVNYAAASLCVNLDTQIELSSSLSHESNYGNGPEQGHCYDGVSVQSEGKGRLVCAQRPHTASHHPPVFNEFAAT